MTKSSLQTISRSLIECIEKELRDLAKQVEVYAHEFDSYIDDVWTFMGHISKKTGYRIYDLNKKINDVDDAFGMLQTWRDMDDFDDDNRACITPSDKAYMANVEQYFSAYDSMTNECIILQDCRKEIIDGIEDYQSSFVEYIQHITQMEQAKTTHTSENNYKAKAEKENGGTTI